MNPPFAPTDEQRETVKLFAGYGIPQEAIAAHIDIDPKTLRLHFRHELDEGMTDANAKVAKTLFEMATQDKNTAAAIFWLKARAGWREKSEVELTGRDGGPIEVNQVRERILSRIAKLAPPEAEG